MYIKEGYVSPKYKLSDCFDLFMTLTPDSDKKSWSKAIEIFRDRIEGRFLNTVNTLLETCKDDPSIANGFAIMALNCLLIETLQQFYEGVSDSKNRSQQSFVKFLTQSPFFNGKHKKYGADFVGFDRRTARIFYSDVRCGILHQAETKSNVMLSYYGPYLVDEVTNLDWIMFDIKRFTEALNYEYQKYISRISDDKQTAIRTAFCKKWEFILEETDKIRGMHII